MQTTNNNDILFDDAAMLKNKMGKNYLTVTAENLSPDCNCSGYTAIEGEEYLDCTNNSHD